MVTLLTFLGCACSAYDDVGESPSPTGQSAVVLGEVSAGCQALQLPSPREYDLQLQLGTTLEPGQEGEFCAIHRVGDQDLWLNWSDTRMSAGAHHGLLWQATYKGDLPETDRRGDPIELGKLVRCEGGANSRFEVRGVVAGSQGSSNSTAKGVLPEDAALHIPARSYVVMNFHMLNASERTLEPCLKVGIHGIDKGQVKNEAGVLFYYNGNIAVPASGSATARMACPITQDISLKSAVSHMHARGVGYEARWLSGDPYDADTQSIDTLYETKQWDAPVDTVWSEPRQLKAGNFIDYHCDYQNPDDRVVAQGLDTTDEMCMLMGVYWPRSDAVSNCLNPATGRSAAYQIGSGHMTGPEFLSCVIGSDFDGGANEGCGRAECRNYAARYHLQSCFTQACPGIGRHTQAYYNCLGAHSAECQSACDAQPSSCRLSCLNERSCAQEVKSLQESSCEL
jgi:hypothetical protein